MRISKVKSKPTLYFGQLDIGDLFEYEEEIYMKIEEIKTTTTYFNAVNLEQGFATKIFTDDAIEPIYEDDYIFEVDF